MFLTQHLQRAQQALHHPGGLYAAQRVMSRGPADRIDRIALDVTVASAELQVHQCQQALMLSAAANGATA